MPDYKLLSASANNKKQASNATRVPPPPYPIPLSTGVEPQLEHAGVVWRFSIEVADTDSGFVGDVTQAGGRGDNKRNKMDVDGCE